MTFSGRPREEAFDRDAYYKGLNAIARRFDEAMERDDVEALVRLNAEHPNCGGSSEFFREAILNGGSPRFIAAMIGLGADVNAPDECALTPLMYAAQGDVGVVRVLTEAGADPNALAEEFRPERDLDRLGEPALFWALVAGNQAVIDYLTPRTRPDLVASAHDALRRRREREARAHPARPPADLALIAAVESGSVEALRAALAQGADVNLRNDYGFTPLSRAAFFGNLSIVRLLLDNGADPNAPDADGGTPLEWAVRANQLNVIPVLLDSGADPDRPGHGGRSPREWADDPSRREAAVLLRRH